MKIDVKYKSNHYEIYVDGQFYCSVDSMNELNAELERMTK